MKKSFLLIIAIVLCAICLLACNNDDKSDTDNSTDNNTSNVVDVAKFDLQNVENLQCEIRFGETGEELVFEKEKALELYNIIANCNYTELDGMPAKSSVNPSTDYIYINFTGDKEELPTEQYGYYYIYTDDVVGSNLSIYMSHIRYYQYEEGLYNAVSQYIEGNR